MKKRLFAIPIILLTLTSLVSAYGTWSFSIGDFFDSVDTATMVLGVLFVIFLIIINLVLGRWRLFKGQKGWLSGIVSAGFSLLIVYGIYKTGLDFEDLLYSLGLDPETLGILIPIVLILGFLFLLWKLKSKAFLAMGIIFILVALLTEWVYEKGAVAAIGAGFIILYVLIHLFGWWRHKKKDEIDDPNSGGGSTSIAGGGNATVNVNTNGPSSSDLEKAQNDLEKQRQKTQEEADKRNKAEANSQRKFALARKIGINNLQKERQTLTDEYTQLLGKVKKLNSTMTGLGGSTPQTKWQKETDQQFENRKKKARDAYNEWYRGYARLEQIRKKIAEIDKRIEHLNKQLQKGN